MLADVPSFDSVGAGGSELRIVHYFIFDGDSNKDFIKGLGLEFMVPFKSSEKLWDRCVRRPLNFIESLC